MMFNKYTGAMTRQKLLTAIYILGILMLVGIWSYFLLVDDKLSRIDEIGDDLEDLQFRLDRFDLYPQNPEELDALLSIRKKTSITLDSGEGSK